MEIQYRGLSKLVYLHRLLFPISSNKSPEVDYKTLCKLINHIRYSDERTVPPVIPGWVWTYRPPQVPRSLSMVRTSQSFSVLLTIGTGIFLLLFGILLLRTCTHIERSDFFFSSVSGAKGTFFPQIKVYVNQIKVFPNHQIKVYVNTLTLIVPGSNLRYYRTVTVYW